MREGAGSELFLRLGQRIADGLRRTAKRLRNFQSIQSGSSKLEDANFEGGQAIAAHIASLTETTIR